MRSKGVMEVLKQLEHVSSSRTPTPSHRRLSRLSGPTCLHDVRLDSIPPKMKLEAQKKTILEGSQELEIFTASIYRECE